MFRTLTCEGAGGDTRTRHFTWKYLLKIEKSRYSIFVLFLQFRSTIKHSFTIVWSENTIPNKKQKEKVNMEDKKEAKENSPQTIRIPMQIPERQHFTNRLC